MDVRCEKCLTVYELDDTRVGAGGLTVKCQECGNLFKVRRRPDTAELVVAKEPVASQLVSDPVLEGLPTDVTTRTEETTAASTRARRVLGEEVFASPIESEAEPATIERPELPREVGWMLRSAKTGQVQRFRELTTLQAWIVERKVSRQDEISRGGESWKPLGGIAELASFFHVVEQAEAIARATQPGLAVRRANQLGGLDRGQIAQISTELNPPLRPSSADDEPEVVPRSGSRTLVWGTFTLLVVGLLAGGYISWQGRQQVRISQASDERAVAATVDRARAALASDTDEGFREVIAILDPVVQPRARIDARELLAEAHVLIATYLAEDARAIEAANPSASKTVRAEAQAHLANARRVLEPQEDPEPRLALARADLLRAESQPSSRVEQELTIARTQPDTEVIEAEGELALRDGKLAEARAHFAQTKTPHGWFRLAQLDAKENRVADEKTACDALLAASPKHERGRALCSVKSVSDMAVATGAPDLGAVTKVETESKTKVETESRAKDATPGGGTKDGLPGDYKSLVREGDRLAENGRSRDARKRYERALELQPRGVQAFIGLGYCDLDAERFLQAVDRFNAALAIDPDAGDALVGLAESYRIRGRTAQALELYKKYLAAHPTGDKAQMAHKALQDLDRLDGKSESTPLIDRITVKPQESSKSEDAPLPRLPSQDP